MITTTRMIALAHQEWTLNNNSRTKDNPPYCPCHTRSASYCHAAFLLFLCVRHVVPSLYHLVALYDTVSGCRRATLIIPHPHFFFHLLAILSLYFFDVFPIIPQKSF